MTLEECGFLGAGPAFHEEDEVEEGLYALPTGVLEEEVVPLDDDDVLARWDDDGILDGTMLESGVFGKTYLGGGVTKLADLAECGGGVEGFGGAFAGHETNGTAIRKFEASSCEVVVGVMEAVHGANGGADACRSGELFDHGGKDGGEGAFAATGRSGDTDEEPAALAGGACDEVFGEGHVEEPELGSGELDLDGEAGDRDDALEPGGECATEDVPATPELESSFIALEPEEGSAETVAEGETDESANIGVFVGLVGEEGFEELDGLDGCLSHSHLV